MPRRRANGDCVPTLGWTPGGRARGDPDRRLRLRPGEGPPGAGRLLLRRRRTTCRRSSIVYVSDIPEERTRGEWIAGQYRDILGVELSSCRWRARPGSPRSTIRRPTRRRRCSAGSRTTPIPQNWLSLLWTCGALFAEPAGYCNPAFDELVAQGDRELDPEARIGYYEEAHRLLLADAPMVFVANQANVFLVKPYVTGYRRPHRTGVAGAVGLAPDPRRDPVARRAACGDARGRPTAMCPPPALTGA